MSRKVNLVGKNTLTVSLPSKWVRDNKIRKGDELAVTYGKNSIAFATSEGTDETKEIKLNIDNFTYMALSRYIAVLYKTNYEKIVLTYTKPLVYDGKTDSNVNLKSVIQRIVSRLIGAEVVSQSSTKTEIECFVKEEKPDLEKIERRIYFLLKETTDEMLMNIGPEYHRFHESIYDHHDNITKFIYYFLRSIHDSEKTDDEKKLAFAFYTFLDHIVDNIRHISENVHKHGCTPKAKKYLSDIFEVFFEQWKLLSKKQISQEVIERRYALMRKIKNDNLNAKELRVLSEALMLTDMGEFQEYILVKNLGENDGKTADI